MRENRIYMLHGQNESSCVINRKEMKLYLSFSNDFRIEIIGIIISFFLWYAKRSGDLLPCWLQMLEATIGRWNSTYGNEGRWDTSVSFSFFFFLHVSFIQSRANKAQSLQRIIESSKYLRANYVMGSNCARVHGINTMGEKSQSASNRRAKRKTRFFFFFSVKKKRRWKRGGKNVGFVVEHHKTLKFVHGKPRKVTTLLININ